MLINLSSRDRGIFRSPAAFQKEKVLGNKFRLETVADRAKYSKKGKAELSFFVLKATCSQGNLQIFQPTEALAG